MAVPRKRFTSSVFPESVGQCSIVYPEHDLLWLPLRLFQCKLHAFEFRLISNVHSVMNNRKDINLFTLTLQPLDACQKADINELLKIIYISTKSYL